MIIWLASYPKSGNTLVRTMLSAYLFSEDGIFNFELLRSIKQFPHGGFFLKMGVDMSNQNETLKNYIKAQELFNKKNAIQFFKTRSIDLHGYTLEEANKTIENFIIKSFQENINKLIVVTGKGIHSQNERDPYVSKDLSILKYSVPEFISNNKNLLKIIYGMKDAKIEDGGTGAFYIFLKKNKSIK